MYDNRFYSDYSNGNNNENDWERRMESVYVSVVEAGEWDFVK